MPNSTQYVITIKSEKGTVIIDGMPNIEPSQEVNQIISGLGEAAPIVYSFKDKWTLKIKDVSVFKLKQEAKKLFGKTLETNVKINSLIINDRHGNTIPTPYSNYIISNFDLNSINRPSDEKVELEFSPLKGSKIGV